jgi:hypothetical protein
MKRIWQLRWLQISVLGIGTVLGAMALSACYVLSVNVTSVTGTYLQPYGSKGTPVEEVDFTMSGYTGGKIICVIEVFNDAGQAVGSTIMTTRQYPAPKSGIVERSVPVDIAGPIFNGTASNAFVKCGSKG